MNTEDKLISVKDCAEMYAVSVASIYAWSKDEDNGFPSPVTVQGSSKQLFSLNEVQDYLQVVLDQRRIKPVTRSPSDYTLSGFTAKELQIRNNRRRGYPTPDDDFTKIGGAK